MVGKRTRVKLLMNLIRMDQTNTAENIFRVNQDVEEKWGGSDWDGWKTQRMIYESWMWRCGGKRQIMEKNGHQL